MFSGIKSECNQLLALPFFFSKEIERKVFLPPILLQIKVIVLRATIKQEQGPSLASCEHLGSRLISQSEGFFFNMRLTFTE